MDTILRENHPCLVLVLAALSPALSVGGVRACVNRYIVRKGGDDDQPPTQSKKSSLEEKTGALRVCVRGLCRILSSSTGRPGRTAFSQCRFLFGSVAVGVLTHTLHLHTTLTWPGWRCSVKEDRKCGQGNY